MIDKLGCLADRTSINIELPSENSLKLLAPQKEKAGIIEPMSYIAKNISISKQEKSIHKLKFVPAGQTTQLMVGATPETDLKIMKLSENLYQKLKLKRVYYSAYVSVNEDTSLPALKEPPLLRENRLYQADWLLRFYDFTIDELLDEAHPNFNPLLDPKCDWALRHLECFPIEINQADYHTLLRVPGIGVMSAKRIITARRAFHLNFDDLKKLRVVLKRARYFITCDGKYFDQIKHFTYPFISENLLFLEKISSGNATRFSQISLFDTSSHVETFAYTKNSFNSLLPTKEDKIKSLTGSL